jgi:membrane-bound metal-dependent hydrolase YbcI (DUF457 family)
MASPIAHSFAGFWTFLALRGRSKIRLAAPWRQYLPQLGMLILLANLPDLDLLMGFPANPFHRGFTHSLAAAILISLALSCVWRMAGSFWRSAILYFAAYGSHLLIDLFTGMRLGWTKSGYGVPLLWPWPKNFSSPLTLFPGVRHQSLSALFSLDNVWSCTYELLICSAVTIVALTLWK